MSTSSVRRAGRDLESRRWAWRDPRARRPGSPGRRGRARRSRGAGRRRVCRPTLREERSAPRGRPRGRRPGARPASARAARRARGDLAPGRADRRRAASRPAEGPRPRHRSGVTRLATDAGDRHRAGVRRCSWKKSASSTEQRARARHEHEPDVGPGQQRAHRRGPLLEARRTCPGSCARKSPRSREHLGAGEAGERLGHVAACRAGRAGAPSRPAPTAGARSRRGRLVAEEVEDAVGRLEEVEGVGGGRRVEHDEVVVALGGELVELLHGHVLLGAGQGAGHLLVDAVVAGCARGVAASGAWRVDQVVPGALHVEHHGEELAPRREARPRRRPRSGTRASTLPERPEPERGGEAPGRVDGADQHAPARPGARQSAMAAATEVLPTPPRADADRDALARRGTVEERAHQQRSPARSDGRRRCAPRLAGPQRSAASSGSGSTRGRQVDGAARGWAVPARLLGAARLQDRRPGRRPERAAVGRRARASRSSSAGVKRASGMAFTKTGAAREPRTSRDLRVELDGLGDRHLLGQGHERHRGAGRVDEERLHPLRVAAQRPGRHGVEERPRRRAGAARRGRWRGRPPPPGPSGAARAPRRAPRAGSCPA